jgi:hypothetical protein
MSKERARRREAREQEAAVIAAARASSAERRERRDARRRAPRLPRVTRRRSRPAGILAARRRRQLGGLAAGLLALNVLVWLTFPDWPMRMMALIVSLLAAPVLHTMLFRR